MKYDPQERNKVHKSSVVTRLGFGRAIGGPTAPAATAGDHNQNNSVGLAATSLPSRKTSAPTCSAGASFVLVCEVVLSLVADIGS
jgi:hypothetical protein